MGEAKVKRTRNQRLIAAQPYCIYCGGERIGSQIDHVPPIALFALKRRPEGLEFVACKACHKGTRKADLVAAFMTRFYPDLKTEDEAKELGKLVRGISNNVPTVKFELDGAMKTARADQQIGVHRGAILELGPATSAMLEVFAARMGLAFHFLATGKILPEKGAVAVHTFTNIAAMNGDFPEEMWTAFPSLWALHQKGLTAHEEFQFGFVEMEDCDGTASIAMFRKSFAVLAICSENAEELGEEYAEHLFRPGFLVGLPD